MSNSHKIDLETFKLIADTIFDANHPETMGSQVARLLVGTMEVKGVAFFIVNPAKEELELLATEGLSADYKNKGPILVDKSIKLESNLEPIIIADTLKSNRLQYPEKAIKEGIRSIVSLPLKLKGKIVGALRIYHSDTWDITEQDLSYLEILTKNLAMALKYFRLSAAVFATKETMDEIHSIWL
ncbi:MAG: GAF domain-containing protein [Pseudomonadota bacterium]